MWRIYRLLLLRKMFQVVPGMLLRTEFDLPTPSNGENNFPLRTSNTGRYLHLMSACLLDYCWLISKLFEAFLQCEFKDVPVERQANCGWCRIFSAKLPGLIINTKTWRQVVFTTSELEMSIIIVFVGQSDVSCPRQAVLDISSRRMAKLWGHGTPHVCYI